MTSYSDKNILDSWVQNAKPWIDAVCKNEIESRILITNKAIIGAILGRAPQKVLDIGCGEGWLARELNKSGIDTLGIDAVPELVEEANKQGGGVFRVLAYEDLSSDVIEAKFDVVVCNFSLLGNESVTKVFEWVSHVLNDDSFFIVQTIHPISGCGDAEYKDGWRNGSWSGFNNNFRNPPPWYFRALDTWKELFQNNGFGISEILEPINPKTKEFASIIFIGVMKADRNK